MKTAQVIAQNRGWRTIRLNDGTIVKANGKRQTDLILKGQAALVELALADSRVAELEQQLANALTQIEVLKNGTRTLQPENQNSVSVSRIERREDNIQHPSNQGFIDICAEAEDSEIDGGSSGYPQLEEEIQGGIDSLIEIATRASEHAASATEHAASASGLAASATEHAASASGLAASASGYAASATEHAAETEAHNQRAIKAQRELGQELDKVFGLENSEEGGRNLGSIHNLRLEGTV